MLYFDRTDISEETSVHKTSKSKECDIFHYWYFLNKAFEFQPDVWNECYDLLILSINLSDIATLINIKCSDYLCIISLTSKNDAINLLQNADLTEKSGAL